MMFAFQEKKPIETKLASWIEAKENGSQRQVSQAHTEEDIRLKCGEYIRFLSQVYYPLLTATFYYLFRSEYPDAKNAYAVLTAHIEENNLLEKYAEKATDKRNRLNTFTVHEKQMFAKFYTSLQDIMCDKAVWHDWQDAMNIDYVSTRKYQAQIEMTVLKEKVSTPIPKRKHP